MADSNKENETEQNYRINDRRIANQERSIVQEDPIQEQNGKSLVFSFNGLSFYGEVWGLSAKVINATEHYWSETKVFGNSSVTGGGGRIDTDSYGRTHGTIDPIQVSNYFSSASSDRSQLNIWYRLDTGEEKEWKGFPLQAREGHSITIVCGMIEGSQPFCVKVINHTMRQSSGMGDDSYIKNYLYDLSCFVIEKLHLQDKQSKQEPRSLLSRILGTGKKKRNPNIPMPTVLADGLLAGFERLVNEKY